MSAKAGATVGAKAEATIKNINGLMILAEDIGKPIHF